MSEPLEGAVPMTPEHTPDCWVHDLPGGASETTHFLGIAGCRPAATLGSGYAAPYVPKPHRHVYLVVNVPDARGGRPEVHRCMKCGRTKGTK